VYYLYVYVSHASLRMDVCIIHCSIQFVSVLQIMQMNGEAVGEPIIEIAFIGMRQIYG
jgi:hypothetical protein